MNFDSKKETLACIEWMKDWFFNQSGGAKGVVGGVSGGKDSTIVAALCEKAFGPEKVLGIMMPNGIQADIEDSKQVIEWTKIQSKVVNIENVYQAFAKTLDNSIDKKMTKESMINVSPRLRMTVLYAVAQSYGYCVCGTSNLSEKYIGYSTKWGDGAADFNPIGNYTSEEVVMIGRELGLPEDLISKIPSDGLCGKTDEDNFGFTYQVLNQYIRTGICDDEEIKEKIDKMYRNSRHKIDSIPMY